MALFAPPGGTESPPRRPPTFRDPQGTAAPRRPDGTKRPPPAMYHRRAEPTPGSMLRGRNPAEATSEDDNAPPAAAVSPVCGSAGGSPARRFRGVPAPATIWDTTLSPAEGPPAQVPRDQMKSKQPPTFTDMFRSFFARLTGRRKAKAAGGDQWSNAAPADAHQAAPERSPARPPAAQQPPQEGSPPRQADRAGGGWASPPPPHPGSPPGPGAPAPRGAPQLQGPLHPCPPQQYAPPHSASPAACGSPPHPGRIALPPQRGPAVRPPDAVVLRPAPGEPLGLLLDEELRLVGCGPGATAALTAHVGRRLTHVAGEAVSTQDAAYRALGREQPAALHFE
eukprot:TRINITY_DN32801_c0_g1_i1.p2 TRINITY_DN32801_c0_g1~~TRINITY_DN32801_c0_g1_i1.p2  ORF type:complete len:379 (+),score=65.03 TRINITY_DN32801_c0_g1_i1:126-1139(+)